MDRLLLDTWSAARRSHRFPELPAPGLGALPEAAVMRVASGAITLDSSFFSSEGAGRDQEPAIRAALDHALTHHTLCPFDAALWARLVGEASRVLDTPEAAARAAGLFVDAVADHHLFFRLGSPIHLIYRRNRGCRLFRALLSGYQRSFGEDLGVDDLGEVSERLARLPFLERARWPVTIKRFARLMAPFVTDSLGEPFEPPLGNHGPASWSASELSLSLGRLARETHSPGAFGAHAKTLAAGDGSGAPGTGSIGSQDGTATGADHLYYMKLAAGYNLSVAPGLFTGTEEPYPAGLARWEAGESALKVDAWTSFGKYLPGLSQMRRTAKARVAGRRVKVPDLLIMLDSSASMPDPSETRSWAVLACGLAANAYLKNGAGVAVYNFSNAKGLSRRVLDFTRNRTRVFQTLCLYFGGGTTVNIDEVRDILDDKETVDVFLMTDMEILNLGGLIRFFAGRSFRVSAVHLGRRKGAETFRSQTKGLGHITVFKVDGDEDLPKLVLGQAQRYLGESLAVWGG